MMAAAKTISISGDRKKSIILNHLGSSFQRPSRMSSSGEMVSQEMNRAMDLISLMGLNVDCCFMVHSV